MSLGALTSDARGQSLVGFKAGAAMADVRGEVTGDHSPRVDFTASFFVQLGPREGFSVQLEAAFTERGTVEQDLDDGLSTTYDEGSWEYRYWDLAVLPKFTVGSGPVRGAVYAGPYLGTLFTAKLLTNEGDLGIRGSTKPIDLGGIVGISMEAPRGLLIDLRYSTGFGEFDGALFDRVYRRKHSVIVATIGKAWS